MKHCKCRLRCLKIVDGKSTSRVSNQVAFSHLTRRWSWQETSCCKNEHTNKQSNSYHIISYHIYHIIFFHIIYHIISYITSYHIRSDSFISYHNISYIISYSFLLISYHMNPLYQDNDMAVLTELLGLHNFGGCL